MIQLRSPGDDSAISGIDDERNGILLRKDLHMALGNGKVAFIKV